MAYTQQHSTICRKPGQARQRRRHQKRQPTERTSCATANGFLKHAFAPVIGRDLGILGKSKEIEMEFYNSLRNFAALYGLKLPRSNSLSYPFNIAQSFETAKQLFKQKNKSLDVIILKDNTHKSCVATVKTYNTGCCLYYMPVKPLSSLFKQRNKRKQRNMLLSVFAYLHQVAGMPYFIDGFLEGEYEHIYDWYSQDPDEYDQKEYTEMLQDYRAMNFFGKKLLKSIRHKYHLQQFENRVTNFKPATKNDTEILRVGTMVLNLYKQYPSRNLFDSLHCRLLDPDEEDRILPDQYVSFSWKSEGLIFEQLLESVNCSFQEIACTEEPKAIQIFDQPQAVEKHDLDFEQCFFDRLDHLADLLNDL